MSCRRYLAQILDFIFLRTKDRFCEVLRVKRYVVYMPDLDFFYYPYYDLFHRDNVQVIKFSESVPMKTDNRIIRKLCGISYSSQLNTKRFRMPFKKLWYPICTGIQDSSDEIVFLFWGAFTLCSRQYRRYLKKHFPNCKITFTMFDLAKLWLQETNDMKNVKDFADAVFSYDIDDVQKYGLIFHRDAFSVLPDTMIKGGGIESDLNFCGKAKDRYDEILAVYNYARKAGINCDFNVPKLPQHKKDEYPELAGSIYIPYIDYIKRIQGTNCLLEICQSGKKQYTLRPWEAIAYGKKILTSNKEFLNEEFYDPKYIQVYEDPASIDWDWVREKVDVDYHYIDKLSVDKLLSDYDHILNEMIQ